MGQRPFSKPVFLKLSSTGNFQARSAWEALEYLDRHWQGEETPQFKRAKHLCQGAVDGLVSAKIARMAVADAAQRAGLLERGWKPKVDIDLIGVPAVAEPADQIAA